MSSFQLKIIAFLAMIIDHIGIFIFPQILLLQFVGRISFPLFAFLIANGAYYSKNKVQYLLRLLIVALISQFFYILAFRLIYPSFSFLNVLFTFSLALSAIIIISNIKNKVINLFVIIFCCLLALTLNVEYGIPGVLLVLFNFFSLQNRYKLFFSLIFFVLSMMIMDITLNHFSLIESTVELLCLFSFVFIYRYNNNAGRKIKFLFYFIYPLHFLLIYIILINRSY